MSGSVEISENLAVNYKTNLNFDRNTKDFANKKGHWISKQKIGLENRTSDFKTEHWILKQNV